ncbi:MAG: hypothetical protein AMXMBFR46_04170 [Acidimicrobiia bacterium]
MPRIVRRSRFSASSVAAHPPRRSPRLALGGLLGILLGMVVAGLGIPSAGAAVHAQGVAPGSVAALEARLREAQAASDAAAARFQEATAKHDALADEIAGIEARIAAGRARTAELRAITRQRAVTAYKSRQVGGGSTGAVFSGGDPLRQLRRTTLLQHANAEDDAAVDRLRVLDEDLGIQKAELGRKKEEAAQVVARLEVERTALAASVAAAQGAYDELVNRLAREAASRAAAEAAARRTVSSARRAASGSSGTPVAGFLCPVRGSFTNDFGDARSGGRSHAGIDVFAGTGTPVVAVKSGTLTLEQGGAGGNAAYLNAGDGNTYYFAHFSSYAASPGPVSQGQVIGYVGQTGNATAPHLHFEIRGAGNPYATLTGSC